MAGELLAADTIAAMRTAHETARSLGRESIDSDVLLLALLTTTSGTAAGILAAQGISEPALRDQIAARWPELPKSTVVGELPNSAEAETIFADALKISHHAGADTITTRHVLLALVRLRESLGAQLLWACTADLAALEATIEAATGNV